MKIAISGAGIAGCALAFWLRHHGLDPVLIERAPCLRTGGYAIDFWGVGYDVVERMGLLPRLHREGYVVRGVRLVGRSGSRVGGFSGDVFARATDGRFVTLLRGDLVEALFETLDGGVEFIFDDSIAALEEDEHRIPVELEHGGAREFDPVIGADGLHSNVRALRLGPEEDFVHHLGYAVAAFTIGGYQPRDELVYVGYARPGMQVMRFALRDDRTVFMFVFAHEGAQLPRERALQEQLLLNRLGDAGWESRHPACHEERRRPVPRQRQSGPHGLLEPRPRRRPG